MVVDARRWTSGDTRVLADAGIAGASVWLIMNKIDLLDKPNLVLPRIDQVRQRYDFEEIVPLSAKTGDNLDRLITLVGEVIPEGPPGFPITQITDSSVDFIAA
jgi:GTP-binding protein Era